MERRPSFFQRLKEFHPNDTQRIFLALGIGAIAVGLIPTCIWAASLAANR